MILYTASYIFYYFIHIIVIRVFVVDNEFDVPVPIALIRDAIAVHIDTYGFPFGFGRDDAGVVFAHMTLTFVDDARAISIEETGRNPSIATLPATRT